MEAGQAQVSDLPGATQLAWPTLQVLTDLGGSGTNQEILDAVVERQGLTEEQQSIPRADGLTTELNSRLSLARTYLKAAGAVESSGRGVWAITERGRQMTEDDTQGISGLYQSKLKERREGETSHEAQTDDTGTAEETSAVEAVEEEEEALAWKDRLLRTLRDMDPSAFERLALRLLREAGFSNAEVTGRSGDEGIDGSGVYSLSLISFPVYFQCKRYSGSVGPDKIRDFRGAMEGRGDKGLMITTGTFTVGAKNEATRAGARPIDLIDGDRLCSLLKEYSLGVDIVQVEQVRVRQGFFEDI